MKALATLMALVVIAWGMLLGAAGDARAQSSPTTLAKLSAASAVSAYDGFVAWSAVDPTSGRYELILRRPDGTTGRAPIAAQRVPFDVDLGPGPDGTPWAVYSRCKRAPRTRHLGGLPDYASAAGCRVYRLALANGRERRLDTRPARSAFAPTIWRENLAFAGTKRRPRQQQIYQRRIGSNRPAKTRRAGPSPRGYGALLGQDLRGAALAFTWAYSLPPGGSFPGDDRLLSEVRLDRGDRGQKLLGRITLGPESTPRMFTNPSIDRGTVSFATSAFPGSAHNALVAHRIRDGSRTAIALDQPTLAITTDGAIVYRLQATREPDHSPRRACTTTTAPDPGCLLIAEPR